MSIVLSFIQILCNILSFAIFARALLSWFPIGANNPLVAIVYQLTEPIMAPLRRIIPRIGMIDITPIVAILLLQFIARFAARGI